MRVVYNLFVKDLVYLYYTFSKYSFQCIYILAYILQNIFYIKSIISKKRQRNLKKISSQKREEGNIRKKHNISHIKHIITQRYLNIKGTNHEIIS